MDNIAFNIPKLTWRFAVLLWWSWIDDSINETELVWKNITMVTGFEAYLFDNWPVFISC